MKFPTKYGKLLKTVDGSNCPIMYTDNGGGVYCPDCADYYYSFRLEYPSILTGYYTVQEGYHYCSKCGKEFTNTEWEKRTQQ